MRKHKKLIIQRFFRPFILLGLILVFLSLSFTKFDYLKVEAVEAGDFSLIYSFSDYHQARVADWADFDNDGDLDLIVGNFNEKNKLYLNENGVLNLSWESPETDQTTGIKWGDIDLDGDQDLVVGNQQQQNRIYENISGTLTLVWNSVSIWAIGIMTATWIY